MSFPTTAHINPINALADLQNVSIQRGYTPATTLDGPGMAYSILANLLTTSPALFIFTVAFDMASVASATTAEQAVTVTGVASTDICIAVIPASGLNAGLAVTGGRVTAANQVTIRISNSTAGALDPASQNYTFVVIKP